MPESTELTEAPEQTTEQERDAFFAIKVSERGLTINTAGELYSFAKMLSRSQFAPKDMKKPQDLFIAMCHGQSLGIYDPLVAVQSIAVINGRPSIWGDGFLGLIQASGLLEQQNEHYEGDEGTDDFKAVCVLRRKGNDSEYRNEFSVRDAKAAGLWGKTGPWSTSPKRMLKMRARAFSGRDGFSDILKGLTMREEVEDYIDVTATPVARPSRLDEFVAAHEESKALPVLPPDMPDSEGVNPSPTNEIAEKTTKRKPGRPRKTIEPPVPQEEETTEAVGEEPVIDGGLF